MTGQTPGAQPVQGPSQPTRTDLIWATTSSQAALNDSGLSARDRLAYLEAEAATYTAAVHLGVQEATAEECAAEMAAGEPTLTAWALSTAEPEAGL